MFSLGQSKENKKNRRKKIRENEEHDKSKRPENQSVQEGAAQEKEARGPARHQSPRSPASQLGAILPIQHSTRTAVSHINRHKLHQLLHQKQIGYRAEYDGLSLCEMHSLHHGLRSGRIGKARAEVQGRFADNQGSSVRADRLYA